MQLTFCECASSRSLFLFYRSFLPLYQVSFEAADFLRTCKQARKAKKKEEKVAKLAQKKDVEALHRSAEGERVHRLSSLAHGPSSRSISKLIQPPAPPLPALPPSQIEASSKSKGSAKWASLIYLVGVHFKRDLT